DDPSEAVKKAMSRRRPVKAAFTVIAGGKDDDAAAEKPKRKSRAKSKASAKDAPPAVDADDPGPSDEDLIDGGFDGEPPESSDLEGARHCCTWDQNDRDNARRLIYWFGADMAYIPGMGWLTFTGTHWLRDEGELQVSLRAQAVVDKIKLEALVLE